MNVWTRDGPCILRSLFRQPGRVGSAVAQLLATAFALLACPLPARSVAVDSQPPWHRN